MPHATLDNRTAFAAEVLHLADEDWRPLAVFVVKATFDVLPGGGLARSAHQAALHHTGELHYPDRDESSYRREPEVAPFKPATDVALVAHAHAPRAGTTVMDIQLRVGPLTKRARVFGDRTWHRSAGADLLTAPAAFATMPVVHERAFGGWDRAAADPREHRYEPRNPVGRGFHAHGDLPRAGLPAPNIEDIDHPIRSPRDTPPPASFGFISPNWQPRAALAGTYDDAWRRRRCPSLPVDFDRRHFNAAAPGLVADGYLRGDEEVLAEGLSPDGRLRLRLPGVPPPTVRAAVTDQPDATPPMALDTLILDLDARTLSMFWRAHLLLPRGPHDLRAALFASPESYTLPRAETARASSPAANQAR